MSKILIIEDDKILANIYRNKFVVEGFQAETANDGETGLEMVHSFRPDAVLLDLILPKMSGIELMKKVRAESAFQQLPVIVFSNTYLTNMVQEAWKAGATKCLSKANCTPNHVIAAVRSALKGNGTPTATSITPAAPETKPAARAATAQPSAASKPSAAEITPGDADADADFTADLQKSFIEGLPTTITAIRGWVQGMIKAENETIRLKQIQELYRRIHALTGNAAITGLVQIAQLSDALEALLKELYEKPANVNASTMRTVASAVDCLAILFERATAAESDIPPANILVVDDEAISLRAINYALQKAKLKSVSVEDPLTAFQLLSQKKFDLVLLDVGMPEMNGFELCSKIRMLPQYKKTPVVFITCLTDLESRANSTMSGGNDFIAKPFLFVELSVKALVHVLRAQIESEKK